MGWGILLKSESDELHVWLSAAFMLNGVAFLTWSARRTSTA